MGLEITLPSAPASSGGSSTAEQLLSTTTVDLNSAAEQTAYTVPAGKVLYTTRAVLRDPSADMSGMDSGNIHIGGGGASLASIDVTNLTTGAHYAILTNTQPMREVPAAGTVAFQLVGGVLGVAGTAKLDLFGYLIDA